jgi:ATP-dependent DNA ligase
MGGLIRAPAVRLCMRLGVSLRGPAGEEEWSVGPRAHGKKRKSAGELKPVLVGQFEFVEWTPDDHLQHSHFVAFRTDKKAKDVVRE